MSVKRQRGERKAMLGETALSESSARTSPGGSDSIVREKPLETVDLRRLLFERSGSNRKRGARGTSRGEGARA